MSDSRHRTKCEFKPGLILKGMIASFVVWALSSPALAQLPTAVYATGAIGASMTITFTVAPPSGSTVSCSLALISNDVRAPSDTQSISAPVNGSTATCQILIYYNWRLTVPANDTMTIAYSVQGPVQNSSGIIQIIPIPSNGTQRVFTAAVTQ